MKKFIMFFSFLMISTGAYSQTARENGFYAVVTTGPTTFNFPSGNTLKSNGYQFGAGYDINKNFAAEITYGSLYQLTASGTNNYDESITAVNFSVLALYPVENFTPYVKLSASTINVELSSSFSSYKETNTIYVYGIGTEVKLDMRTSLRLEYATSQQKSGYTNADYVQAGVIVRF
jgi:hypothetical protein